MHLVAVVGPEPKLERVLRNHLDAKRRFHFHPVPPGPIKRILEGLTAVDFAGALLFDEAMQKGAFAHVSRSSLDAQEAEAVDTVTVTQSGTIGEYNHGRALSAALREEGWDAREAKAVVVGSTPLARAVARDLSSVGVIELTVLAENRPKAEAILSGLAASTVTVARASNDPLSRSYLEQADLLVRVDPAFEVPDEVLGPHLTVVDLGPEAVSKLRGQALRLGSMTLNLRDIQGHHIASALKHILGGTIHPGPFLEALHKI
jgi:shikimate 5-dehydrogenase